jgi:hypothetical protein
VRARCCTLHAAAAAAVRCCCVRPYRRLSANNHTWFVIEVACSTGGSGNAFGPNINHSIIEANMKALTAKSTMWPSSSSTAASLADLGYTEFGIDEGWELCNKSFSAPGGEQHDADGKPMTNTTRFPDLGALVMVTPEGSRWGGTSLAAPAASESSSLATTAETSHSCTSLALMPSSSVGYCHAIRLSQRRKDAGSRCLMRFSRARVESDNCGAMKNLTLYAELMQSTGKNYSGT